MFVKQPKAKEICFENAECKQELAATLLEGVDNW